MSKHRPFGMDKGTHEMCEKLFNEGRLIKAPQVKQSKNPKHDTPATKTNIKPVSR